MNQINIVSVYQNSFYDRAAKADKKQTDKAESATAAKKTETRKAEAKPGQVELSQAAKDLLKELKEKYNNMDFIIADYDTDEEAAAYLSRGVNEYSVLLKPEELEKMATNETEKALKLSLLDETVTKLEGMKKELGSKADEVSRLGICLGENGEVSVFAELEKVNEKQRERIEEKRQEKKEAAAEEKAERDAESPGNGLEKMEDVEVAVGKYAGLSKQSETRKMIYADSVEELMQKIAEVDWTAMKEVNNRASGQKFDFIV